MKHFQALAIMVLLASPALAQVNPPGSWQMRAGDVYWNGGGSAGDDSGFYVLAGTNFRRFDPATNTWIQMAASPSYVNWGSCAYANGCVYSFGGTGSPMPPIMKYTIATSTWSTLTANINGNGSACSAAALGTKIYITGGNSGTTTLTEFDITTEQTRTLAPMPVGMTFHTSTGFPDNGKLYVNNGGMYEYDPAQNSWTAKAGIGARLRHTAFILNHRIYVAGGQALGTRTYETQEYNPSTDAWIRRADLVEGRYMHAGAAVNGKGYVYGGYWASGYSTCEEFTPPDFGAPPFPALNVRQSNVKGDVAQGGWTGTDIKFSADLSDPDATDTVSLDVQVKPVATASWNALPVLTSGLQVQGTVSFTVPLTTGGDYDWRYRVVDMKGNIAGPWIEFLNNAVTPDFKSDQTVPTATVGTYPINQAVTLHGDSRGGSQIFTWNPATDNGGIIGLTYDLQVSSDYFQTIDAAATGVAGTSTQQWLAASVRGLTTKHWRVRAIDATGNVGVWSPTYIFQVVLDDQLDHGAGDASKCGMSTTGSGSIGILLAALAVVMGSLVLKR